MLDRYRTLISALGTRADASRQYHFDFLHRTGSSHTLFWSSCHPQRGWTVRQVEEVPLLLDICGLKHPPTIRPELRPNRGVAYVHDTKGESAMFGHVVATAHEDIIQLNEELFKPPILQLKEQLFKLPIIALPWHDHIYTFDTDSSDEKVGGFLHRGCRRKRKATAPYRLLKPEASPRGAKICNNGTSVLRHRLGDPPPPKLLERLLPTRTNRLHHPQMGTGPQHVNPSRRLLEPPSALV